MALVVVAVVVFCGGLGAAVWYFKVATSDIKGAGDQTRIVNDAQNRINSQEWFHGQYAQIVAADAKLDGAKANLDASIGKPDESMFRTAYTGLKNRCVEMRENYNAEAQKVTRAKWLDTSLPVRIDDTDRRTDCQENTPPTSGSPR